MNNIHTTLPEATAPLGIRERLVSFSKGKFRKKSGKKKAVEEKQVTNKEKTVDSNKSNEGTALVSAVNTGNVAIAQVLLDNGAEVEGRVFVQHPEHSEGAARIEETLESKVRRKEYGTPLTMAVQDGNEKLVGLLLEKGADPDGLGLEEHALKKPTDADFDDRVERMATPLVKAVELGNLIMVKLLLIGKRKGKAEANGRLQSEPKSVVTPLMLAVKKGRRDIVDMLLKYKAEVDATDENGMTALHHAALAGHEGCIEELLRTTRKRKVAASITAIDNQGRTPLMLAASNGHSHVLHKLMSSDNINLRDVNDRSAVDYTVINCHFECFAWMLGNFADIYKNEKRDVKTPYDLAVEKLQLALVNDFHGTDGKADIWLEMLQRLEKEVRKFEVQIISIIYRILPC